MNNACPTANRRHATISPANSSSIRPIKAVDSSSVILEARRVSKVYRLKRQKVAAIHEVNLQIMAGEFVAITGASGSGKSTLLQLLGGLDKPTSGEIYVDGTNLSKLSDGRLSAFRRQTIGFIFQSFYLQPFLTIGQNIAVPAMFARTKQKLRATVISDLLAKVGLSGYENRKPSELSGGQVQRIAIARALVNNPRIILADEPTGNLDSKNSAAIVQLFRNIQKELGSTIIIVTHNPDIAMAADRVIRLRDGEIIPGEE